MTRCSPDKDMNVLLAEETERLDDAAAGSLVPVEHQRQHDALHRRSAHVLESRWYSMVESIVGRMEITSSTARRRQRLSQ